MITREEAIKEMIRAYDVLDFSCHMDNRRKEAFNMAKVALEQEPCEDAISRQAVLGIVRNMKGLARAYVLPEAINQVKSLLPVNPQPKTGHWILKRLSPTRLCGEHLKEYECSECYREIRCTASQLVNYPYCHCGAKMESEDKE